MLLTILVDASFLRKANGVLFFKKCNRDASFGPPLKPIGPSHVLHFHFHVSFSQQKMMACAAFAKKARAAFLQKHAAYHPFHFGLELAQQNFIC